MSKSCCKTDDKTDEKKQGSNALFYFLEAAWGMLFFPKRFFRLNEEENGTLFNLDNVSYSSDNNKLIPQ